MGRKLIAGAFTDSAAATFWTVFRAKLARTSAAVLRYASGISTGSSLNSVALMSLYRASRARKSVWSCWANSIVTRSAVSSAEAPLAHGAGLVRVSVAIAQDSIKSAEHQALDLVGRGVLGLSAQPVAERIDLVIGGTRAADLVGHVLGVEWVAHHGRQIAHELRAALVHDLQPRQVLELDLALLGHIGPPRQGASHDGPALLARVEAGDDVRHAVLGVHVGDAGSLLLAAVVEHGRVKHDLSDALVARTRDDQPRLLLVAQPGDAQLAVRVDVTARPLTSQPQGNPWVSEPVVDADPFDPVLGDGNGIDQVLTRIELGKEHTLGGHPQTKQQAVAEVASEGFEGSQSLGGNGRVVGMCDLQEARNSRSFAFVQPPIGLTRVEVGDDLLVRHRGAAAGDARGQQLVVLFGDFAHLLDVDQVAFEGLQPLGVVQPEEVDLRAVGVAIF